MVQPEDILRKARNLYRAFLRAWLAGDTQFFPRVVPTSRSLPKDMSEAIAQVQRLREHSKEVRGFGYTVEWRSINSRQYGRNPFPLRIVFSTREDLLQLVRKEREFDAFAAAVERVRAHFPSLDNWIRSNPRAIIESASQIDGLLEVLQHLCVHPRPGCFARELPLNVDTKFLECHQPILREWLNLVLPATAIRAHESHFERRFGLRYDEPQLCVRFLDPALQLECRFPCSVVSLPLPTLASWTLRDAVVFVVENRTNLLTLPAHARSLALGGLGNAVTLLRDLAWLADNSITYWGDIDVEGFQILSRLRLLYPHVRSVMMDSATLRQFPTLVARRKTPPKACDVPSLLTDEERAAFLQCQTSRWRLEQERLPQDYVIRKLAESTD